jgi:hypothetical protein
MTAVAQFERHPKTGLPVESVPTFKVGDLVTEHFLSDGHPGVVVAVTPKTVWVAGVDYQVGNVSDNDVPGWNGYGDSATLVVDPESVERAVARGREGASKYVHRVGARPTTSASIGERETYGGDFHRASWKRPNSSAGYLSAGARYRRDPHV